MSNRLNNLKSQLADSRPTRIAQYRLAFPLERNQVRDFVFGERYRKVVDDCFDVMIRNRHIFQHSDLEDFSRAEERQKVTKMILAYHKLRPVSPLIYETDPHAVSATAHASYLFSPQLSVRCDITIFLYSKTLLSFSRRGFGPHQQLIRNGLSAVDIGCFGLTEIGHGSNTKDLETEAVYEHGSRSFVFNTPKETGFKFWIGGAAEIANMAVIWAQLVVKGKRHGVHPFAIPIRDKKTMRVLEGVLIGDCGAKQGLHGIDNGAIGFVNYKVGYDCMLDRVAGVDQQGNFTTIEENLERRHGVYMGAISSGRAFIALNATGLACNALNIGLKYSCMRRQFQGANKQEQAIIDYPLVRHKLMPLIANAYIFFIVGCSTLKLYDDNSKEILDPRSKLAGELHAISAAGKSRASWFALDTIGTMRHLLGGHGYSSYSRLGRMYYDQDANVTWEGDNHMLLQQAAKYILKQMSKLRQVPDPKSFFHFVNEETKLPEKWTQTELLCVANLKKIYQLMLQQTNDELVGYMLQLKAENKSDSQIWNEAQSYLGKKIGIIFNDLYYITVAQKKINTLPEGPLKQITINCLKLWLCHELQANRWGTVEDRKILQVIVQELSEWLTPRSVALIEAISAPEEIIGSPFADKNGDQMWQKYLGLIYSGKDVFSRVPYYEDIVRSRHKDLT